MLRQLEQQPAPAADTVMPLPSQPGQIQHGLGRDEMSGHENILLSQPEHTLTAAAA